MTLALVPAGVREKAVADLRRFQGRRAWDLTQEELSVVWHPFFLRTLMSLCVVSPFFLRTLMSLSVVSPFLLPLDAVW